MKYHTTKRLIKTKKHSRNRKQSTYKGKGKGNGKGKGKNNTYRVRKFKGGNYETDITTRMTDGVATKPLNKIVVTVPGYGTMSGTSYKRLMEEIDRDGPDAFYK